MSELNLKQITDKLNEEFVGDLRKLVFWYDDNAEFLEDIESLELDNAKILRLEQTNQFKTKYFLECVDTTTNYLVYAPFPKPNVLNNHLEDMILYSKEFFVDKTSVIMADFGIDEVNKHIIQKYVKSGFFNNKERIYDFSQLAIDEYNESTIETGLMSVLAKNKTNSFEETLRIVITNGDIKENEYLETFAKFDLLDPFWNYIKRYFGYDEPNPTLEKLMITMFVTYAARTVHEPLPDSLKRFISYKAGNVIVFLDNLMNSSIYKDRYDELSQMIYRIIDGNTLFSRLDINSFVDCNIFSNIDRIIIDWMISRLEIEDIGAKINDMEIPEVCSIRRKMHYGETFKSEYYIIENAFYIISNAKYKQLSEIDNIIKAYTSINYLMDRKYRYFYYHLDKLEDASRFENLRQIVENIYTNEYLNEITTNWNIEFADARGITELPLQRNFYEKYIENSKDRVVVIISDALRYEVAETLYQKLGADEKCTASIGAMQGVLPSYTPLGMASLLPHKKLEYTDNYDVLVDGSPCSTTQQREQILQKYKLDSKCVQFDEIYNMKQADMRSIFTGQDVVYIYHNQIDARGDMAKTENEVFNACEEAILEIHTLIRRISSLANTHHFFVTADHGFIYKRDRLSESDKISGIAGKTNYSGQRYSISEGSIGSQGICSTTLGQVLGSSDERIVSFPLASDIFKVSGAGQNYVHGGSSPQEMLVPLVEVKVERGKTETSVAKINLLYLPNKITNLLTTLEFMQTEPVSDVVKETKYRIYFVSENNEKISNEHIYIADKKDAETKDRLFTLRFSFKNKQYDASQKYYIAIYDDNNDIELMHREVIIDIAFADDYGFFN